MFNLKNTSIGFRIILTRTEIASGVSLNGNDFGHELNASNSGARFQQLALDVATVAGATWAARAQAAAPEKITTPYGTAVQEQSAVALRVQRQIQQGATVYKGGVLGRSEIGASQFLAIESPLTPGYAGPYGLPPANSNFDFVLGGRVYPGDPVITRSAPGIPPNPGGGIEAVIKSGSFEVEWFHMP